MSFVGKILVFAGVAGVATSASANFIDVAGLLSGETQFDGWDTLSRDNPQIQANPGAWPTFPGAELWPEPLESNVAGSGDARFDKVSGLGYPAGFSIYASPFGNGVYSVTDSTLVADIETVVFQIQIGSGSVPETLSADPTLTINGTTDVALFDSILISTGVSDTGFGPVNVDVIAFQWDLRGLGPVNSIDVGFEPAGTSTTIVALQLDQGGVFAAIPAPGAAALLGAAGLAAARRRRSA